MVQQPPTFEQLQALQGQLLGTSAWHRLDQQRIDGFADITEDWQFIHVNSQRAQTETPFGGTIAHGFLTLSLLPAMGNEAVSWLDNLTVLINYGFNKMRFLTPVPSGSSVRGHFILLDATAKPDDRVLLRFSVEVEVENRDKPTLVAEWLGMAVLG